MFCIELTVGGLDICSTILVAGCEYGLTDVNVDAIIAKNFGNALAEDGFFPGRILGPVS